MAFTKKNNEERRDEGAHDYLRFPMGTRITATASGKLSISFAGDVSIGETLPELGELSCGRNLSFDPGVTLRSDRIDVKSELEIGPGCKLTTDHIKAEKVVCKRATVETKTIETINLESESTNITADAITAKENVYFDKGDLEIGTVTADSLTLTKGTAASVMIADVNKIDGFIQKGGYTSLNELLAKLGMYRPEILNEKSLAEARRLANIKEERRQPVVAAPAQSSQPPSGQAQLQQPPVEVTPESVADADARIAEEPLQDQGTHTTRRLREQLDAFKRFYGRSEMPKEVAELCAYIETGDLDSLKKNLNSCYQRLAVHKIPNEVMEIFYNIQRVLKEDTRLRREQVGKA